MRKTLIIAAIILGAALPAAALWPFSKTYTLTVVNGSGSGAYKSGAKVVIMAAPRSDATFAAWLSAGPSQWGTRPQDFVNPNASATTFTMPKHDETIQATYTLPQ